MDSLGGHCNKYNLEKDCIKYLKNKFCIKSIIDIGCGIGQMKSVCDKYDIVYHGLEGDPLCKTSFITNINFNEECYESDIIYDLGYSIEFLEHVDQQYMKNYINAFINCKYLLITAAPPSWPGHHHVNCQNHEYWIKYFNNFGFVLDCYTTLQIRKRSSMNKHRKPKKRFIQHRCLFFINTKFKNITLIDYKSEYLSISENIFYKSTTYYDKHIKKYDAKIKNTLKFESKLPLISFLI